MAPKKKKNKRLVHKLSELYDQYWKSATLLIASITASFWLGVYYEEVKKNREITEIEDKNSREVLEMKEEYMNKYLDLRERYLDNKNDSIYGNKKN